MFDRLIQLALKNRMLVSAIAAFVAVYGTIVLINLPIDVFPDLNRPTVTVQTEAPGMAPEEVETLVTLPLEAVLNGLPGVERVRSSSGVGLSFVYVEFAWGTDIFRNRQLVAEKLALAKETLPSGITPIMGPISSIMGEIMLIGLKSEDGSVSPIDLRTLAEWTLRPRLMTIPGVSQVISMGGGLKQYQILISAEKLKKFQLTLEDVEENLSRVSRNTTGGFIDLNQQEYLVRNLGTTRSLEDIANSVVGLHFGRPILVKDIAQVRVGARVKRGDGSVNAKPAVIMSIQKQPDANTVVLTEKIEKALNELEKALPKGVQLEKDLFKQSHFIENAINNVKLAMRDGVILVFIVLFLFLLNFRTTLITLTAIPLSFVVAAIIMKFFGIGVNTMTLGGLAVAIGELVDDAIVDVENVFRRLKENRQKAHPESSLKVIYSASTEVRNSIVFATIIVILVFIPLFYLSGIEGRLFIPLGVAYITAILASLLVSLTVTPVLCSFLLTRGKLIERPDGALVRWLKRLDQRFLTWGLNHSNLVIASVIVLFIGAISLAPFMGKEFLPKFNEGTAMVSVIAKPGISLEASNELGRKAEEMILKIPEVKSVARRTGRAELDEHAEGVHNSEIDIDFNNDGRSRDVVLEEIREKLQAAFPQTSIGLGQPISHRLDHMLSGVRAQIAIKVFGPDLALLRMKAAEIQRAIEGTEGLVDLQIEKQVLIPQVKIQILRDQAAKFGIAAGELTKMLETALNGEIVAQIVESQRIHDLYVRFDDQSRANVDLIKSTTVKIMPDGQRVTLQDVADVYESTGPNMVNRENAQRRIVVQANASGRDLGSLVKEVQTKIREKVEMPEGYFLEYGGQFESQKEASRLLLILGAFSILGIFLVLFAHFRSSFIAVQIMLNIPLAAIGSLIAVFISDRIFSVATLVGFITLCGISSRNGIMMISHYLHLMKFEGEKFTKEMVIRGSLERLVPVLMTALTAALALIPFALSKGEPGREILQPLAVVILGGLLSSTLLDMIVTPTVFWKFGRKSAEKSLQTNSTEFNSPHV